jgi:hypothetical protein
MALGHWSNLQKGFYIFVNVAEKSQKPHFLSLSGNERGVGCKREGENYKHEKLCCVLV